MPQTDPRDRVFSTPSEIEVFQSIVYENQVWQPDPFDVDTLHADARQLFRQCLARATGGLDRQGGQLLLIKGGAGVGKTHLMRVLREITHGEERGYFAYLQMTTAARTYDRYILRNVIDGLDKPYRHDIGRTGLALISMALTDHPGAVRAADLDHLAAGPLEPAARADLVAAIGRGIERVPAFAGLDDQLIQALVTLQCDDPPTRNRVLRLLRGDPLTEADRALIGGLSPRDGETDAPLLIRALARLIWQVEQRALVICLDQMEQIQDLADAPAVQFRRAIAAATAIAEQVPNAVIVLACLEDVYDTLGAGLSLSLRDRIERDPPAPITLDGAPPRATLAQVVARRLEVLYASDEVAVDPADPLYPFAAAFLDQHAGASVRSLLAACHAARAVCIETGRVPPGGIAAPGRAAGAIAPPPPAAPTPTPAAPPAGALEALWNDLRTDFAGGVPDSDAGRADLLAWALADGAAELAGGFRIDTRREDLAADVPAVLVRVRDGGGREAARLCAGLCGKSNSQRAFERQLDALAARAAGAIGGPAVAVAVRATPFPGGPTSRAIQRLGAFVKAGGRTAVVEESDWRTLVAFRAFAAAHGATPGFAAWRRREMPLLRLGPLQAILAPQRLRAWTASHGAAPDQGAVAPATPPGPPALVIGDAGATPVGLPLDTFGRHVAIVGDPASGAEAVAARLIEALLGHGVSVLALDRGGTFARYAEPAAAARLPGTAEVALFTPGAPGGRPLPLALLPADAGGWPATERGRLARLVAACLAGLLSYSPRSAGDRRREQVLAHALELAAARSDRPVTLDPVIAAIDAADDALIARLGEVGPTVLRRLVEDLTVLRLGHGRLFATEGTDAAAPDAWCAGAAGPRLTIVTTAFLDDLAAVAAWGGLLLAGLGRADHGAPAPDRRPLGGVVVLDAAERFLPARSPSPARAAVAELLRRGPAAGLGVILLSDAPADLDPAARTEIGTWLIGRLAAGARVLGQLRGPFAPRLGDLAEAVAAQPPGHHHLITDRTTQPLVARPPLIAGGPVPRERLPALAERTG